MKIRNAVCYSFYLGFQDAMAHLRLIAPLQQAGIHIIDGVENGQPISELVQNGDIVVVQRDFPRKFDDYQKIVKIASRERKPMVFDLDDLLLFLPENHPDRAAQYYAPSLLPMFQAIIEANLVTVATPRLQSVLAGYNNNVVVLPNYFDDALWHLRPPVLKSKDEILTIGFMGGNSHQPDIKYVMPVLLDLVKRYPRKIRFHFWGIQPPAEMLSLAQVELTPHYSYSYKEFSAFFQSQSADIFIAPLVDNLFNQCKSPLKFFEYSALGAPGVFSHLETYSEVVSHGKNGLLAASLDQWTDCLIQLIENDELRFQLATQAQTTIRENWLLSQNAFRWNEAFERTITTINSNKEQDHHIVNIVSSINSQSFETFQTLNAQVAEQAQSVQALSARVAEQEQSVQALSAQVAEKEQSVQALSAQVVEQEQSVQALIAQLREITISKAWRVAMLLRRISLLLVSLVIQVKKFLFSSIHLFLWPMRKVRVLLIRNREMLRIERWQEYLMKARNRIQPELRLDNGVSKKVSIIIPNYNGKGYLGECINSLRLLDFPPENYEIIVVDNASSDGSTEFISSMYPDVLLIQAERNLGFAGGCNLGIKNSRGAYVVLLNNDTVVETNWLKELLVVADSKEEVAIVGSKLLFKHSPNKIQNAMSYLTDKGDGGDMGSDQPDEGQYDTTREVMAVCGASMLIRRTLIEEIGALDEDFLAYYEDMDLCYRTRLYGRKIIFASKSVVYHVHAATSGEWSPFFTFLVFRNKLLMHLKNSRSSYLLKVLFLYFSQVIYEGFVKGVNRKTHIRVLASFAKKLPKFLIKRIYVRSIVKRKSDNSVLLRLTKVKSRVDASSVNKVCVYNAYLPTMGGGENLTAHTIAYINSVFPSASIDILCHETDAFDKSRFFGKELVQMLEREFNLSLKNTAIRFVDFNFNRKSFIGGVQYINKLSSITKEYDLFINNTYASILPAYAKVNIYSCMFPQKFEYYGNPLMGRIRRLLFNRFLLSYDMFLAISQYTQSWVDNYWKVNSYVLYPPVKTLKNSINQNKDNIIINVGRFFVSGHNKKQDVMVKAFIEMCDKGWAGDWKLVLAGRKHTDKASSRYIQFLEESAKGYPIELRYDTSVDELQNLLNRAKIYWHATGYGETSNINPERFEHFGLSTIEAAQFGVVPVVFNAGGQPEIINHAKNGFLWNTTNELMDYTKLLMDDDRVRSKLGGAAFDSMKIFSEEKQLQWFILFLSSYYKFE